MTLLRALVRLLREVFPFLGRRHRYALSAEMATVVSEMACRQSVSRARMVRRCIALMRLVEDEWEARGHLVIISGSGGILREIVP